MPVLKMVSHGSSGAVCCAKCPACAICCRKNETRQWQTICATLRLLNTSQPELIIFGILLSHIACDITISLGPILYWLCCSNPATGWIQRHIWKQNCSLLHTTQSNISSAASASDSNSRYTAPPINVFDIDIVISNKSFVLFVFVMTTVKHLLFVRPLS